MTPRRRKVCALAHHVWSALRTTPPIREMTGRQRDAGLLWALPRRGVAQRTRPVNVRDHTRREIVVEALGEKDGKVIADGGRCEVAPNSWLINDAICGF